MKKAVTTLAGLCIVGIVYYLSPPALSEFFSTQIDPTTEEGKRSVQELITGTWVHTDTLCKSEVDYLTTQEFIFGIDLPPTTIGAVRLKRDNIDFSTLKDNALIELTSRWFEQCDRYPISQQPPIVVSTDNLSRSRTFLFYPDLKLILMVKEDGIYNLIKQDELVSLPVYQGTPG